MRLLTLLILLSFLGACNNRSEDTPDGGPCNYKKQVLPATLIALKDINEEEYEAVFTIEQGTSKDTLLYSSLNHQHYVYVREVPKDSLHIGSQYRYITETIISGSCNPHIEFLRLQPFGNGEIE